MTFLPRTSLLAAAIAGGLLVSSAQAAVVLSDGVDGTWGNATQAGRGAAVDFIPLGDGSGVLFTGVFSYDAAGNPVWVTMQPIFTPGQTSVANVQVNRFTGGNFGNPFTPSTGAVVGSATVTLASCSSLTIALDMTPASGLADVTLSLSPAQVNAGLAGSAVCAEQDFTSTCPAGTTASGDNCQLPTSITNNLFLPAGKKYIVQGRVNVAAGGSLTVAPGVTVEGSTVRTSPNFISVSRGGRIYAEGTASNPITFTGPQPTPGSWAGIVIAGESICNDATATQRCQFEAVPDINYGNATPVLTDNSGVLRYVRIRWAGQQIAPNEELNSLTLLAVGSGTVIENVQVDGGLDDGFEMFGGSVNGRYLVCSNMGDDCFDFDQGYNGKIQFALGWQGSNSDIGGDSNGIESDNDNPASDKLPRTQPSISNMTLVGTGTVGNEGVRIRRGSGGNYSNLVVTGYRDRCFNLIDPQTYALASAQAQGAQLSMANSFMGGCIGGTFEDTATAAYSVTAFYNIASAANGSGDPALNSGGFLPTDTSPVLTGGSAPADGFFVPTSYRGAFRSARNNWTAGWTVNIPTR
ncbi:MAG: hypothetical protein ACT4NL_10415 [Pseudomarimonas sp.]